MKRTPNRAAAALAFFAGPLLASIAAAEPTSDWTGFYAGFSVGYAGGVSEHYYDRVGHGAAEADPSGGVFAVTGGYNHQFDNGVVLGVEADLGVASIDDDTRVIFDDHKWDAEWDGLFGALRGRLGYAHGDTLVFASAGVSFLQSDEEVVGDTPRQDASNEGTLTGFAGGLGVEHRLWDETSLKVEWV